MSSLTNPHDAYFKKFLTDVTAARDFLDIYLPPAIKTCCELDSIQIAPGSFVEDNLRQHFCDILYAINMNGSQGYIYCLIEHVSRATKLTPFQVLCYQIAAMKQHLDQGHKELPVVYPLLFYRGEISPYPGPTHILDCFKDRELAKIALHESLKVIDLSVIPDEEIRTHRSIALLEMVQKHIRRRNAAELIEYFSDQTLYRILNIAQFSTLFEYIIRAALADNLPAFIEFFKKSMIEPEYREAMNTVAEYLRNEGHQAGLLTGRQEGLQEGLHKGEQALLTRLLKHKFQSIPEGYLQKMSAADSDDLLIWGEKVLEARTLDEVFGETLYPGF